MSSPWVASFLRALADTGIVTDACREADISSTTAYARRRDDADFSAAWDQALEDAQDAAEREARRRGIQGVQEPVVYQGQLTPVWARSRDGSVLMETYEVAGKEGGPPELHQRPVQEVDANGRPVWLTITRYSDPLLALLLKGRRKKVFADRTELTGADGGPVATMDSTTRAARIAYLVGLAARRKEEEQAARDFGDLA